MSAYADSARQLHVFEMNDKDKDNIVSMAVVGESIRAIASDLAGRSARMREPTD